MNSPYNLQLEQIQQHLHRQLMGGLFNNNMNNMNMMLQMQTTPKTRQQELSEPIVLDESEEEDDEEQRTLFVANLDERVTEEILYEVFLQAGPIERTRIPKDNSGRQRTFGFVTYNQRCSPPYAMHLLQGLSLFRKSLTIKYQGKLLPPPLKSPILNTTPRQNYDNSSLRSGNFSSYNDNKRMMNNSSPCSSRHQERISKHASNQMRPHSNSGPYQQRRDSPNHYNEKRRYSNNNNNNNNHNNNRYSDKRNGKYRR